MTSANVLQSLAGMLASGGIEVVDCSGVLGPETPLLKLPPDFAKDTPPIKIHRISEYDKDGPFWAWNWLELGEHSGTHFDAPHHWITGKDYADGYTDTLDVQRLVAPVNVLGTAICVAACWPLMQPVLPSTRDLLVLALFGATTSGLAYMLFLTGSRLIPSSEAGLIALLDVVLGPLWVWLVFAEEPGLAALIGGGIVLTALVWYLLAGRPAAAR